MLRSLILYLSRQRAVRTLVETSAIARRFSSRFVAGHTLEEAIVVGARAKAEGISVTLDYLGENVKTLEEAGACLDMSALVGVSACSVSLIDAPTVPSPGTSWCVSTQSAAQKRGTP